MDEPIVSDCKLAELLRDFDYTTEIASLREKSKRYPFALGEPWEFFKEQVGAPVSQLNRK